MRILNKKIWPYQITIPYARNDSAAKTTDRLEWLNENIKSYAYVYQTSTFCFNNEKDAMWFALRWA